MDLFSTINKIASCTAREKKATPGSNEKKRAANKKNMAKRRALSSSGFFPTLSDDDCGEPVEPTVSGESVHCRSSTSDDEELCRELYAILSTPSSTATEIHATPSPPLFWMPKRTYEAVVGHDMDNEPLACSSSSSSHRRSSPEMCLSPQERTQPRRRFSPVHRYDKSDSSSSSEAIKSTRDSWLYSNKNAHLLEGRVYFWGDGRPESTKVSGELLDVILELAKMVDSEILARSIGHSVNLHRNNRPMSARSPEHSATAPESNRILDVPNQGITYLQENIVAMTYNLNRFWAADLPDKLREFRAELSEWSDEQLSVFHWNNRVARIAKAIVSNEPSIVALQELRWMETSNFFTLLTQPGMDIYRFEEFVGNGTKLCMTSGLLYDMTKWICVGKGGFWLSDTPDVPSDLPESNGFGRYIGYVDLRPIEDGCIKHYHFPLRIYVVHLSVFTEDLKWKQLEVLCDQVERRTHPAQPFLVMGDFNFFDDCDGKKMRAYMSERYINMGVDAVFSQSRTPARRTFVPYSYDSMRDRQTPVDSTPDHVFGSALTIFPQEHAVVDTRTHHQDGEPEELADYDALPSDHMPLSTRFSIRWIS